MKTPHMAIRPALGPEEVARLGNVFEMAWADIASQGLLKGRENISSLRDLVGQMVWEFHGRGLSAEEIRQHIVQILREAVAQQHH